MALQIRRGTNAERLTITPLQGELIFTTDNKNLYIGDGTTLGGVSIGADINTEDVQDIVAPMFTGGTHTGISFSYNDGNGTINATVTGGGGGGSGTVTNVSVISANGFSGSVTNPSTTPAITITTGITGVLKGNGTAISAAIAGTDYQLPLSLTTTGTSGAATLIGNVLNIPQYTGGGGGGETSPGGIDTYVQYNSAGSFAGSANLTFDGTDLTVGGSIIGDLTGNVNGNVSGNVAGDLTGSVLADDLTVAFDSATKLFYGNFEGELDGNVNGNLTGNVNGEVTGDLIGSVLADDLSIAYDGATKTFYGDLQGNVTGDVSGNVTGNVLGNLEGDVLGNVTGNVLGNLEGDVNAATVITDSLTTTSPQLNIPSEILLSEAMDHTASFTFKKRIRITDPDFGSFVTVDHHQSTANGPVITVNRSRGTEAAPTALQLGDTIQRMEFRGYDGSNYITPLSITTSVSGAVTPGIVPCRTSFTVRTQTGGIREALAFDQTAGIITQSTITVNTIDPLQNTVRIITGHDTAGNSSNLSLFRSRGSPTVPTATNNNDVIMDILYGGHDGTNYGTSVMLRAVVDDTPVPGIVPGRFELYTWNTAGVGSAKLVVKNDGVMQVGNIQPLGSSLSISATTVSTTRSLSLASYADAAARDLAITAPVGGMLIYLEDNGLGAPVAQVYLGAPTNAWTNI